MPVTAPVNPKTRWAGIKRGWTVDRASTEPARNKVDHDELVDCILSGSHCVKSSKIWTVTRIALFALLSVSAANARVTTFAWDAAPSWPIGTTIDLEANGATATGITTTQHTLDVQVQSGEVINARARAVPPTGYQCGDPVGPCPPSPWAEIAQTLPNPPVGLWAIRSHQGGSLMAASIYGAGGKAHSTGNANVNNITVSGVSVGGNNRVLYVAVMSGAGTPVAPSTVKWGGSSGTSLTKISSDVAVSAYGYQTVWRLIAPSSGTNDVYVSWPSNQDEVLVVVVPVQDADQTTPERTLASATGSSSSPSATATVTSGDLVLGFEASLITSATNHTVTTSQTSIQEIEGSNTGFETLAASYATASGTSQAMAYTLSELPTGWGVVAFGVIGASSGNASITLSGNQAAQGIGSLFLSGSALKSITGLSGTSGLGSITIGGGANATASGQSATSGAGTISGTGTANIVTDGIATSAQVGSIALSGGAANLLSGLLGAGSAGTISGTGTANSTPTGISSNGLAGSPAISGTANLSVSGLSGTGSPGILTLAGGANVNSSGISSSGSIGTLSLSGDANIYPAGIYVSGLAGTVFASAGGNVNVSLTGLVSVCSTGIPALSGTAQKTIAGLAATAGIGTATGHGGATAASTGVSGTGSAGVLSLSATALLNLLGASGTGAAGLLALAADASATFTGVGANGQIGTITVSAGANASIILSGAASIGQIGTVSLSASAIALLTGTQAIGSAGFLRLVELITPAGRLLLVESEERLLLIEPEDRLLSIQSDYSI